MGDRVVQRLGRYQQQLHVLGEMNHTIACDIAVAGAELGYEPADRAVRGHAPQHPLVRRAGAGAVTTSLVTGGSGYFGSLLVRRLVAAGHEVRVLDLNDADDRPADVELIRGDIRDAGIVARRGRRLRRRLQQRRPGAAGQGRAPAAHGQRRRHRVAAARGCPGRRGQGGAHVVERRVRCPCCQPGAAVDRAGTGRELRARQAGRRVGLPRGRRRRGLDVTIVRPRTILGHGRLGIFGILFEWIADGADVFVLGDGDNRYQFVHADDLAEVCLLAGAPPGPAVFNAGTDRFGTMRESLESLCAHAGTGSRVRSLPAGPAAVVMRAAAAAASRPVRAVPLDDVLAVAVVRHRARPRRAWAGSRRGRTNEMLADSYDWFLRQSQRHRPCRAIAPSHHGQAGGAEAVEGRYQAAAALVVRWAQR